jgi:beta-lactamase class A
MSLTSESRAKLEDWIDRNTTGGKLIRAGVPVGWRVGDKTGRGGENGINDIAIIRPPDRAPILLCIYSAGSKAPVAEREAAVADAARVVAEGFR